MSLKFFKRIIPFILSFMLIFGASLTIQQKVVQADDVYVNGGTISISQVASYNGIIGAIIPIPNGINVTDVDINNEPHDDIEETIIGGNIIIYGLRANVTYNNLVMELEDRSNVTYRYTIAPFTTSGATNSNTTIPNNPQTNPSMPVGNTQEITQYLSVVYENIFNRTVDEQGLNYWTQKLSSRQIDLEDFFKNLLSEIEFQQVAPTVEEKIRKIYLGIFQREPDQMGFNFWVEVYRKELVSERSETKALRDVIDEMTDGAEFRQILARLSLND